MNEDMLVKLLNVSIEIRRGAVADQEPSFPVLWEEPTSPLVCSTIETAQANDFGNLSEKQKVYFECSLPRFRFVLDRALQYLSRGGEVLDLGCAPGYISILLYNLGYRIRGIDMNKLYVSEYPDAKWLRLLGVQQVDVEQAPLPFLARSFDGVVFTEILEHIAITHPIKILREIRRVLKPTGWLILTTPNVTNISNILALAQGSNIFWPPELFYGSTDRHNREYTPGEVSSLLESEGFCIRERFLFNAPNNWNSATAESIYKNLDTLRNTDCPLLGNTLFILAQPEFPSDNVNPCPLNPARP